MEKAERGFEQKATKATKEAMKNSFESGLLRCLRYLLFQTLSSLSVSFLVQACDGSVCSCLDQSRSILDIDTSTQRRSSDASFSANGPGRWFGVDRVPRFAGRTIRHARPSNRNGATGAPCERTYFAHIGDVVNREGTFHIAEQHRVLTGMLAPRGQQSLIVFDSRMRLVKDIPCPILQARSGWCEGSKLYLTGDCEIGGEIGNVLDFASGIGNPILTREKRYGSSGGIEE